MTIINGDNNNNLGHNTTTYYMCNKAMITYAKKTIIEFTNYLNHFLERDVLAKLVKVSMTGK